VPACFSPQSVACLTWTVAGILDSHGEEAGVGPCGILVGAEDEPGVVHNPGVVGPATRVVHEGQDVHDSEDVRLRLGRYQL
jgi:hypothetical protein